VSGAAFQAVMIGGGGAPTPLAAAAAAANKRHHFAHETVLCYAVDRLSCGQVMLYCYN